ncbi:MAG: hypothetical protein EPN91_04010 [Salinibacterium sp.]|nr:MAG: hypothetical protein EPN91_04010 [Salinibacterium sp.]
MSDDTPTERFDTPGDAPTERFAATGAAPAAASPAAASSRRTIIILSSIGGALLLALIVLLVLLLARPGAVAPTPTPTESSTSPTPTETASATPTPTATPTEDTPPPASGPQFTNFIAPSSQGGCSTGGPGVDPFIPKVKVAWTSSGATSAWYVNGTSDAADSGYMQIPLNGDQEDFPYSQDFNCSNEVNTYTITLVGPEGDHKSKTWHVTNTGDTF